MKLELFHMKQEKYVSFPNIRVFEKLWEFDYFRQRTIKAIKTIKVIKTVEIVETEKAVESFKTVETVNSIEMECWKGFM
jgi:hypothetical protein